MAWGVIESSELTKEQRLSRLGKNLKGLDARRLERIRDTKPDQWGTHFVDEKGARDLVGHLEDWKYSKDGLHVNRKPLGMEANRYELMADFAVLTGELGGVHKAARAVRDLVLAELDRRDKKAKK